jgi:hypothetical protein
MVHSHLNGYEHPVQHDLSHLVLYNGATTIQCDGADVTCSAVIIMSLLPADSNIDMLLNYGAVFVSHKRPTGLASGPHQTLHRFCSKRFHVTAPTPNSGRVTVANVAWVRAIELPCCHCKLHLLLGRRTSASSRLYALLAFSPVS